MIGTATLAAPTTFGSPLVAETVAPTTLLVEAEALSPLIVQSQT